MGAEQRPSEHQYHCHNWCGLFGKIKDQIPFLGHLEVSGMGSLVGWGKEMSVGSWVPHSVILAKLFRKVDLRALTPTKKVEL